MSAGKGPRPHPIDRKAWDECPLWRNLEDQPKTVEAKVVCYYCKKEIQPNEKGFYQNCCEEEK